MGRRMKKLTTAVLVAGGIAFGASAANAQTGGFLEASDWDVTVGGGIGFEPEYEGGDDYTARFLPIVDVVWRDLVFVKSDKIDGIALGVNAFRSSNIRLGGGINYRYGRDSEDVPATNIAEIDGTIEMFLFGEVAFNYFKFDVKLNQGIDGIRDNSHGGLLADVGFSVGARFSPQLEVIARANGVYASDDYMNTYFSTPAASNLGAFTAGEGIKNVGIGVTANYRLNQNLSVVGTMDYKLMLGDASDSPLVTTIGNEHQFFLGVGLTYTF